jgi:hypothetical protein
VSVTAPIAGAAVHPVRVHTTPADTALDEPGEQVAASPAVPGLTGGTDMLGGDEIRLGHAVTATNSSLENARSYSPTTTVLNRRSGEASSASNAAA